MVPHTPYIPLKKKSKKKKRQEKVPLSHTNSKFLLFYIALHEYHWYIHKVHRIKIFFSPMWQISIPLHILQFANYPWIPEYLKPEKRYLFELPHATAAWTIPRATMALDNIEHTGLHTPDKLYARVMVVHHFQFLRNKWWTCLKNDDLPYWRKSHQLHPVSPSCTLEISQRFGFQPFGSLNS